MKIDQKIAKKVLEIVDAGLVAGLGVPEPGKMCVEAAVCFAIGLPHSDEPSCVGSSVRRYKIKLNDANWSSDLARTKGMRKLAIAQLGSDQIDQIEFVRKLSEQTIKILIPRLFRKIASFLSAEYQQELLKAADRCEKEGSRDAADVAADAAAYAAAIYAAADAAADAADAAIYAADAAADAASRAAIYAADTAAIYAAAYAADAAAYAAAIYAAADAAADAADAAIYAADAAADAASRAAIYAADDEFFILSADIALGILIEMKSPGCEYLYLTEKK